MLNLLSAPTPTSYFTISSRAFNQNTSLAKKNADEGPVFITDRGQPAHVLLSIATYQQLIGRQGNLVEALAQVEGPEEFEPPRLGELNGGEPHADTVFRPASFD